MSFEGEVAKCKFSLFGNDSQRGTSPHNLVKEKYDHALEPYFLEVVVEKEDNVFPMAEI